MKKISIVVVPVFCLGVAFGTDNLICNGNFSDETISRKECRQINGKLSFGVEDSTWNKYGRIEVVEDRKEKDGTVVTIANVRMGLDPVTGGSGFRVVPGEFYEYSFELRGKAFNAFVDIRAWDEVGDEEHSVKVKLAQPRIDVIRPNWTCYRGTFQVPPGVTRASFGISLWWDTKWGEPRIYVGDYLEFDNVSIRPRKGVFAEFAKSYGKPFAVAPVPVTVDARVPFVPDEIYTPVTQIVLRAAINELKALPLAIANLTDQTEAYRVILETEDAAFELMPSVRPARPSAKNGSFGLDKFPSGRIVQRRGIPVKDTEEDRYARRIDPMERIGDARVIEVPPQQAGLVWFDFDTADVRSGIYVGRLRVIPLSEPMKSKCLGDYNDNEYFGSMQDIPVSLEVLPIVLPKDPVVFGGFFGYASSREMFREMVAMGAREFQIGTWGLKFPQDKEGNLLADPSQYQPASWFDGDARVVIRNHLKWAAEEKVKIRFFVGYSCYNTFSQLYGFKKNSEEGLGLWPQWIKAVKVFMNSQGVADEDFIMELWDEPNRPTVYELVRTTVKMAREASPSVRFAITFNYNPWMPEDLDSLMPWLDGWIFYDNKFLRSGMGAYKKVIDKVIARGDYVSHYTCSTRMQEDLDREFRQNAWVAEAYGLKGNHIYQIIDGAGGNGAANWKRKQNGGLIYRSFGDFIPSLRSLAIRQGVQDVKYLQVLREMGKELPEVQAFLKSAAKRVIANPAGGDRYLADRVRDEAAELILKCGKRN